MKHCSQCQKEIVKPVDSISTGYGTDKQGNIFCFDCIGQNDRKLLETARPGEKFTFYLVNGEVTNWPGTFRAPVFGLAVGRHNIAGKRYDFRLLVGSNVFAGTQYGDNTQVAHLKCLKP